MPTASLAVAPPLLEMCNMNGTKITECDGVVSRVWALLH